MSNNYWLKPYCSELLYCWRSRFALFWKPSPPALSLYGPESWVSTQVDAPSPLREKAGMRGNSSTRFYSPHPSPLQQEREIGTIATHCFYYAEKLYRYLCSRVERRTKAAIRAHFEYKRSPLGQLIGLVLLRQIIKLGAVVSSFECANLIL